MTEKLLSNEVTLRLAGMPPPPELDELLLLLLLLLLLVVLLLLPHAATSPAAPRTAAQRATRMDVTEPMMATSAPSCGAHRTTLPLRSGDGCCERGIALSTPKGSFGT